MPYNQQMRALDQQPNLAKLAEMLQSTRSAGNQYSVPDWVPLVGGSGVGDMFLGKSPEEIENWSYGNAPMQIPEMSRVPQFKKGRAQSLADTAMLLSGPAESTARNAAAGNVGMIIKPKGGNWVNDLGNNAYFRELATDLPEQFPRDWLDKKLASYVKNEMATPEDPIRTIAENWPAKRDKLLAEQTAKKEKLSDLLSKYQTEPAPAGVADVDAWRNARTRTAGRDLGDIEKEIGRLEEYNPLHYTPENGFPYMVDEYTRNRRGEFNYPEEGLAKTELGKNWETLSDYSIKPDKIKSYLEKAKDNPSSAGLVQDNPWMNKLDPESVVYRSIPSVLEYTGLDKLAHGLGRAISDNGLPEHLRIDPAKLSRVSVPQAVEHVAKINDWDKYKAYEEAARNPAIVEHKQYPEHGMSLVEIKLPETGDESSLRDALKYEGEQMNNCVGGYCGDVSSGASRIFSLRDRKGEPHVTIETKKGYGDNDLERIVQIKGKQNEMPNAKYFPAIQDFVRSKDWSMVHDLPNSGLKRLESIGKTLHPDLYKAATDKYGKFITDEELNALHNDFYERNKDIPIEGFAEGGLVGTPPTTYDPMKVADIVESIDAPQNYAVGGAVVKSSRAAVKSLGELVDNYVRKVRKMNELGEAAYNENLLPTPVSSDVSGYHISQNLPGILETGAISNKSSAYNNMQGWVPAHVGGGYFYSDPQLARIKWEGLAENIGDEDIAAEMPILRAQLRKGNRLVPDEDVGLELPWEKSYEQGSFATKRPVLINQIDRIYSSNPDITKDLIRDSIIKQNRYAEGGEVNEFKDPEHERLYRRAMAHYDDLMAA